MKDNIETKCIYFEPSRRERRAQESETAQREWINFYDQAGCYSCNGTNQNCPTYIRSYWKDDQC